MLLNKKSLENNWNNVEEHLSESFNNTNSDYGLTTSINNPQKTFQDLWLLDGVDAKTRR